MIWIEKDEGSPDSPWLVMSNEDGENFFHSSWPRRQDARDAVNRLKSEHPSVDSKPKILGAIADLLERSGIDVDDIGRVEKVKLYQGFYKDPEGVAQTVDMTGVVLSPKWQDGPLWPVVTPAKPVTVNYPAMAPLKAPEGYKRAMTLPDMQLGYFIDGVGNLHSIHDESAIDVTLQLVRLIRPQIIVLHGDNADFAELSKYRLSPVFVKTTQATVDRMGLLMAQLRAAAGDECQIIWLEGNHEARLSNYIIDNARAAFGLRRANEPEGWPVLSVPNLARLDEYGVTYLSGYPANEFWLNDNLRIIHGHHVVSNGSTAHRYLANERVSVIYGHIHRRELAERTRVTREGPRTILAMSPGCLARTDGVVPSTKQGTDLFGMPVPSAEDWQQGCSVIYYQDTMFLPEQVPILNGWTIYHGQEIRSTVDMEGAENLRVE